MLTSRDSSHCRASLLLLLFILVAADCGMAQVAIHADAARIEKRVSTSEEPAWLSIDYTGALYGYYRIEPDDQNQAFGDLGPVQKFLARRKNKTGVLLGMGDNFGPEFGASVQKEFLNMKDTCALEADKLRRHHKNAAPEVLYKDENRLPRMAECDNVGRFLMRAGYSAIVPGKEDFLYSARWLREMAVLFQGAADVGHHPQGFPKDWNRSDFITSEMLDSRSYTNVLMLAANLRLNFKPEFSGPVSAKTKLADSAEKICPPLFSWYLFGAEPNPGGWQPEKCIAGGDAGNTVTEKADWLRRLDRTVDQEPNCDPTTDKEECLPVAASMNAQARKDVNFRKQLLENEAQIVLATLGPQTGTGDDLKSALEALSKDKAFKVDGQSSVVSLTMEGLEQLKKVADPDKCQTASKDLQALLCALHKAFEELCNAAGQGSAEFLFPFNARKAAIRLLLSAIAKEQENVGFTLVNSRSGQKALVVGAVGRETMKAVSPVNLELCTKWTTALDQPAQTGDLDICEDRGDYNKRELDEETPYEGAPNIVRGRLVGTVKVGDPVLAVTTVIRAARQMKKEKPMDFGFDSVVVMAQMPRTEAEELAAHVLGSLKKGQERAALGTVNDFEDIPHVDLILSEAQHGHVSPHVEVGYKGESLIPVMTPKPSGDIDQSGESLVEPVSTTTIDGGQHNAATDRLLINDTVIEGPPPPSFRTMTEELREQLKQLAPQKPSKDLSNLENFWSSCDGGKACENSVMTQYLLEQIRRSSHADVVLLEYRDFYFGPLLEGYGQDNLCREWVTQHPERVPGVSNPEAYCKLRVALDRVLWKGDFSERVMVDGKNLKTMLTTAKQETDDEQTLAARDTVDEWLMTFGLTTELPSNLSGESMGPAAFTVPGVSLCKREASTTSGPQYCINGQKIRDDGAYWVATSDHLAQDDQLYKMLYGLDAKYHLKKSGLFLTGEIADEVYLRGSRGPSTLVAASDAEIGMRKIETYEQKRAVLQLDYAKAVAGFMVRKPNTSNTNLATNFAGVADSRATTPSAQEVDFEAVARMTRNIKGGNFWQRTKVGIQSDLEYDRGVAGSITGSQTVTYPLNSLTTGGFLQIRLDKDHPSHRFLLVIAPYQYQQQITGNYLNFKFTAPPGQIPPSGQITVATRRWGGFSNRMGARYEFGGSLLGSYIESGPEYSEIHHVLSDLILPDSENTDCQVSEASFAKCFQLAQQKDGFLITSTTKLEPMTETLHTGGWYWDVHLQRPLDKAKRASFTIETKGDDFAWPGKTLPTQSLYAFTTTGALNFAVIGNLAFSPTYTTFFYTNQGTSGNPSHSLVTHTFSVTCKWYFARDAAVPFWRQLWFQGPASLDQTKTAKMK